jgi:hypothetical protein
MSGRGRSAAVIKRRWRGCWTDLDERSLGSEGGLEGGDRLGHRRENRDVSGLCLTVASVGLERGGQQRVSKRSCQQKSAEAAD